MMWVGIILLVALLALTWMFFEGLKKRLLYQDDGEIVRLEARLHDLQLQKNEFDAALKDLNDEAGQQFMLYEMASRISKSLTEAQAFSIFKNYLKEHTNVKNCLLMAADEEHEPPAPKDSRTQMFYIRGDENENNFLIVEGIDPADAEDVAVLGHQFALVYRRLQLYGQLESTAVTDDLTSLLTHRAVLDNLEIELTRARPSGAETAFVMIDVDHFKQFNDKYGHLIGDQILRQAADTIRTRIREVDMAGRFGGEEFCVILPNTGIEGARLTAERIRKAVEEHSIKAFDAEYHVTISLGIAVVPVHGARSEEIIELADQALYQAKHLGRNRVCVFEPGRANSTF